MKTKLATNTIFGRYTEESDGSNIMKQFVHNLLLSIVKLHKIFEK